MQHLKSAKLARWQLRLVCWSAGTLWASGVAWLGLHYFFQAEGEFGPEINPLEPWVLRLHGAAMIAALIGTGSLLVAHVWRGWNYRGQRILGLTLIASVSLLTVSGYLLYYVSNDTARGWLGVAHWSIGLIALVPFLLHYRTDSRISRN